jgi:DNA-binding transcriptional regulator YdaS (Cro superfamily)
MGYTQVMTIVDPRTRLRRLVRRCGTQRAAAAEMGISTNYLSDLIHGHRVCSDRILAKIQLRRVIVSVRRPRSAS